MASILAPGITAETSSDIVIAAGASVLVGIYSAEAGSIPGHVSFRITQKTPGADNSVATLGNHQRSVMLSGPGTYRVARPAYTGTAFGVFTEA